VASFPLFFADRAACGPTWPPGEYTPERVPFSGIGKPGVNIKPPPTLTHRVRNVDFPQTSPVPAGPDRAANQILTEMPKI
jgi:hypothetical protein